MGYPIQNENLNPGNINCRAVLFRKEPWRLSIQTKKEAHFSTIGPHQDSSPDPDKVALVLGGGGARGYAHLGIAQVLLDSGLEPDMVVGTSMGSVIGAALANRANLDGMIKVLNRLDINRILKISHQSRRELEKAIGKSLVKEIGIRRRLESDSNKPPVKLARLFTFFKLMTKNSSIKELPLSYAAVATDLDKGREILIKEGKVYRATAASSAIPGFIPPVKLNGYQLIDGGIVDTVPVLPALKMGAGAILAVDVSKSLEPNPDQNPLSLFYRTSEIRKNEIVRLRTSMVKEKLDGRLLTLNPPVDELNWLDFNEVDKAVSIGREYARENLTAIKDIFGEGIS
ncbi:patatin-like phospholipase family protein [Candidatus Bipolaricaulota bacterium]|nr:patatin-like phospholipase family protein [Candidatus Bipolaricaulota bacterium]